MSPINFFARGKTEELMRFASRTISARTGPSVATHITEDDKFPFSAFVWAGASSISASHLVAVAITDSRYPQRVGLSVCRAALDACARCPESSTDATPPSNAAVAAIRTEYATPAGDKLVKLQAGVDEVRVQMMRNIELLMERGEKIEDLAARSQDLSTSAKSFVRTSRKLNRCPCAVV